MSETTKIAWCDSTWNPWRGCHHAGSPGCDNCYARTLVNRFGDFDKRVRSKTTFDDPLRWNKKPWVCDSCGQVAPRCDGKCLICGGSSWHRRRVFLGSLMDWLDYEAETGWRADMLNIIDQCPDINFLCLTKRIESWEARMLECASMSALVCRWLNGEPPPNIWLGVTCESQEQADKRIPELLKIPAKVRFLSCEPLLTSINLGLDSILRHDLLNLWVIAGCESGPGRRNQADYADHVDFLRQQCVGQGVAFFHKQMPVHVTPWGKHGKVSHDPAEWPEDLRVREWPQVNR